jgi:hypothetical protein
LLSDPPKVEIVKAPDGRETVRIGDVSVETEQPEVCTPALLSVEIHILMQMVSKKIGDLPCSNLPWCRMYSFMTYRNIVRPLTLHPHLVYFIIIDLLYVSQVPKC